MNRSNSIAALAAAFAKAQGEIAGASKDKTNPHFKTAYADLASVWEACRDALSKHGLSVLQPVRADGPTVTVTTLLMHGSGEWIDEDLSMTAQQNTPQGLGSCITYARRYALASMVGVAPEDDDGNAASQLQSSGPKAVAKPQEPAGFSEWYTDLSATADNGADALRATWTASKSEYRKHLTEHNNGAWEAIKARALKVKASA